MLHSQCTCYLLDEENSIIKDKMFVKEGCNESGEAGSEACGEAGSEAGSEACSEACGDFALKKLRAYL